MAEKYFGHAPREMRAAAVARYLTTDLTLEEVGEQFGTSSANICRWVKAAAGSEALTKKRKPTTAATTSDNRTPQEKLRLLLDASRLSDTERGEFLRREGLRDDDLKRFEVEALSGAFRAFTPLTLHIPPMAMHSLKPVSDTAPIHCFCFAVATPDADAVNYTQH